MLRRTLAYVWAVLLLVALAACGAESIPAGPAATAVQPSHTPIAPSAAPAPSVAPAQAATIAPAAAAQPESPDAAAIPEGLTPEGYHVLGHQDAPVTLVMYSDFL